MKFFQNDVVLLLCFLLLFCFGLSFLHNDHHDVRFFIEDCTPELQTNTVAQGASVSSFSEVSDSLDSSSDDNFDMQRNKKLADMTTEELLRYMKPLFITKSASAIISFLKHIPSASVFRIVQAIVQSEKVHLPPRVKLRIIFAAVQRQKNEQARYRFFNLIAGDKRLKRGVKPLLVKAVEAGYSHIVPDILDWANKAGIEDISTEALLYAARHDDEDPESLRELFEAGVQICQTTASKLLYLLVDSCSHGYSVTFLIKQLGANPNYAESDLTVLMNAVRANKTTVVFELLKNGADPFFKMSDVFEQTAVQIAQGAGNKNMERVLRRHGACEVC